MATHEILDSKFSPKRTDLRTWRELRFLGPSLWSQAEEDKLRQDYLALVGGADDTISFPPATSNGHLWAAAFDRYGVPLSDLFTYGLRPHPDATVGPREKLLGATYCQLLTQALVHPIFEARIDLVRHILQHIVCLRLGVHEPPVGPVPGIDDAAWAEITNTARQLRALEEGGGDDDDEGDVDISGEAQTRTRHDAVWLHMLQHTAQNHPEIVRLEEALILAFEQGGNNNDDDDDDDDDVCGAPYCRQLFYLRLCDLQVLVRVLDGMASPQGYLPTGEYYRQWLGVMGKVCPYITAKLDGLVEAWFLREERNYRVREKLVRMGSDQIVYDVAEEDFRPLYVKSGLITQGMRSILCGDFLTRSRLSELAGAVMEEEEEEQDAYGGEGDEGDNGDLAHGGILASEVEEGWDAPDEQEPLTREVELGGGDVDIHVGGINDQDSASEYQPSIVDENEPAQNQRGHRRRSSSIMSIFSIHSSSADERERNDADYPPNNTEIPQRGLLRRDRDKPMWIRRRKRQEGESAGDNEDDA